MRNRIAAAEKGLKLHRRKIDEADRAVIRALAARFTAVKKIGKLKKKWNIPVIQGPRWNDLMRNRKALARKRGVSTELIEQIYRLIQKEAVKLQKKTRP